MNILRNLKVLNKLKLTQSAKQFSSSFEHLSKNNDFDFERTEKSPKDKKLKSMKKVFASAWEFSSQQVIKQGTLETILNFLIIIIHNHVLSVKHKRGHLQVHNFTKPKNQKFIQNLLETNILGGR